MAVTIVVADLMVALRLGDSPEEEKEATRLLAFCSLEVVRAAPNAPNVVSNEAVIRYAGYLYDQPTTSTGRQANGFRNSGAASILLPYRQHGVGEVASRDDSSGTTARTSPDVTLQLATLSNNVSTLTTGLASVVASIAAINAKVTGLTTKVGELEAGGGGKTNVDHIEDQLADLQELTTDLHLEDVTVEPDWETLDSGDFLLLTNVNVSNVGIKTQLGWGNSLTGFLDNVTDYVYIRIPKAEEDARADAVDANAFRLQGTSSIPDTGHYYNQGNAWTLLADDATYTYYRGYRTPIEIGPETASIKLQVNRNFAGLRTQSGYQGTPELVSTWAIDGEPDGIPVAKTGLAAWASASDSSLIPIAKSGMAAWAAAASTAKIPAAKLPAPTPSGGGGGGRWTLTSLGSWAGGSARGQQAMPTSVGNSVYDAYFTGTYKFIGVRMLAKGNAGTNAAEYMQGIIPCAPLLSLSAGGTVSNSTGTNVYCRMAGETGFDFDGFDFRLQFRFSRGTKAVAVLVGGTTISLNKTFEFYGMV